MLDGALIDVKNLRVEFEMAWRRSKTGQIIWYINRFEIPAVFRLTLAPIPG